MHLKRIELFGFKSFADRTELDFDRTLTGIVGPNGCGKSNVVDAMRWVLGEQRPTSMRGGEMKDVIFKGSASRPAMSVAEATMVLDNADGTIEERGSEIAITRRVYRSGEGEYLIDGDRVRLKDVRNMLYDTGLGSRGYSVLEQGRIDAVLSANPLDRRAIFEEAAGISRYRRQRTEVEARLRRVASDLERLDDVLRELRTRERSLKIQAGKAERYIGARDAWRENGLLLARHHLVALNEKLAGSGGVIAEHTGQVDSLRALRESAEGTVAEREREQGALAGEVDRVTSEASELAGDLRALDERRDLLSKRVAALRDSAGDEERRAAEFAGKVAERRAELVELERRSSSLDAEAGAAEAELERKSRELKQVAGEHRAARAAAAEQNETVLGLLHEKTAARNRLQHLDGSLAPLAERARRARERLDEAQRTLEAAREAARAAAASEAEATAATGRAEAARTELARRAEALASALGALQGRRGERQLEHAALRSRIDSLLDWEREREGLDSGARALLAGLESGAAPVTADALHGLVADHLRVQTEHARALDAALGERAQALVVGDRGLALSVVRWLAAARHGLVRVVLPGGLDGGERTGDLETTAREPLAELLADDRVLGRLREFVAVRPGSERLADLLLADTLLVTDLDAAAELAVRVPGLRCVTLEGDVADATGIAGGHREVAQGPVGRRSSAAELEQRVERLTAELAELDAEIERTEREHGELGTALARAAEELERHRAEHAAARAAGETARARLADQEEAARVFAAESESVLAEEARLRAELDGAREALAALERRFEEENGRLAELERRRAELERRGEELGKEEYAARIAWTRQREQAEGSARRLADLGRSCEEAEAQMGRARELWEAHTEEARSSAAESEELAGRRALLLEQRGDLEERLVRMRELERAGRASIEAQRRQAEGVTRQLEELQEALARERLGAQRHELAKEELLRRAREEFELDELGLLEDFEPDPELLADEALTALNERVTGLKHDLDRLGPVNLEALDELDGVSERLTFLDGQREDLTRARRTLDGTLERINAESERLFLETFEEIRDHFRVIFRRLFGGGRADVVLEEGVPVLEGGIEISARPPGREMLPLGLLSGGQRTLTALALLFAVFRSRPSPFCVLDEVDAALDDANIGRFLGMLDEFRQDTQFVLVTHNKGSMAACDMLYGVTMETRGVSRHVSVELDEVDAFVPDAKGGSGEASGGATNGTGEANGNGAANGSVEPAARVERSAPAEPAETEDSEEPEESPDSGDTLGAEEPPDAGERVVEIVPGGGAAEPSRAGREDEELSRAR